MTARAWRLPLPGSRTTQIALGVLLLSLALRLALIWVNRDANDLHINVINRIAETGALPDHSDCWECFQPKLFHATVAVLVRLLGIASDSWRIFTAQALNFVAGGLTLVVVWRVLSRQLAGSELLRLLGFALLALNPNLIGISSQATNDAFVILFSTVALAAAAGYLREGRAGALGLLVLALALALISKTNAWVPFLAIVLALGLQTALDRARRPQALRGLAAVLVLVPALVVLNPLSQYLHNWRKFGTPVTVNARRAPFPRFFAQTELVRPSLLSIQDGLFTFKYVSLLRHPRVDPVPPSYPGHRTSVWTQLYGRAHSIQFDNWPTSWRTRGTGIFPLLRASFLLALVPTALLLAGALRQSFELVRSGWRRDVIAAETGGWGLLPLAFWGYLAFIASASLLYRDSAMMKAIYIYPALLTYPVAFVAAASRLRPRLGRVVVGACLALLALYVVDVAMLVNRLR